MKHRTYLLCGLLLTGCAWSHAASEATTVSNQDPISVVTQRAIESYVQRLQQATQELNDTRQRVLQEQQPLAEADRQLEHRVAALETEIAQLQALNAQKLERRQQLARESANL